MDMRKFHDQSLAALPTWALIQGVESLKKVWEENPEVPPLIKRDYEKDPEKWWADYHHGWGTAIRNHLRDTVCHDDSLPSGNWDDYYVPLVEISVGLREVPR